MHSSFNVIIFGEASVGKSSLVNLIAGQKVAETSPDGQGRVLESRRYTFPVAGRSFNVWDTTGLGEPIFSGVDYTSAIEKMHPLVRQINAEGGLHLLLFCIPGRGSRVTQTMLCNYRLFFEVLCRKRTPIVLVVTHLEAEARMDDWWDRNVRYIDHCGLQFRGHACVTGLPGHEKEIESRSVLNHLLLDCDHEGQYIAPPPSEWNPSSLTQLASILLSCHKRVKDKRKQVERSPRSTMDSADTRRLARFLAHPASTSSASTQNDTSGSHRMHSSFNIILFGEAGVGKSSIINLIAGSDVANTSPDSWGCTLESKQYTFGVANRIFNIWDTIGLGEPIFSASDFLGAIKKTHTLIQQIEAQGGLDLLLFCMRGSRVTTTMEYNYRLFFEVLCKERIPIAAVVTHLEDEEKMDEWWDRNEKYLSKCGLKFVGHACVTGQRWHVKAAEGRSALELLLLNYDHQGRYTSPLASDWFSGFLERLPRIPQAKELKDKQKELEKLLCKRCKMASADARRLAEILTRPDEED